MFVVGVVLLVVAALWVPVAVPELVRFPSRLDATSHYRGTFTLRVDPATSAPLAEPMTLPLEIDRRVRTLPGGGAHTAVLEEAVTYRIAGTTQRERHHYVIDRRSMQNRADRRSWSFSPEHRVHQAGTYRVTLPLGARADGRYRIWENEPGRSFWMVGDAARAQVRRNGLSLIGLQEVWHGAPVASYYRAELRKQGFATALTFPQLAARFATGGVDVESALDIVSAADAPVVAAARDVRLPLRFFRDNDGHALVEPRTGAIVDLVSSDEAITAAVDLAPLRELRNVLGRAASSPHVAALADALDALDRATPAPVYSLRYEETPASVAEAARRTKNDLRQLDLVERYMPRGLAALSVVLLVLAGLGRWRARPTEPPAEGAPRRKRTPRERVPA
jgi:Porin PorA